MTYKRIRSSSTIAVAILALAFVLQFQTNSAKSANLIWDSSGANPAAPVDGSGNWDTTTARWSNGATDSVWDNLSTAVFGSNNGAAGTVTIDDPALNVSAAGLIFNAAGSGNYTIATSNSSTLTLASPTITVASAASPTINVALAGSAGLTLNGGGTLNLGAVPTYTGNTTLDGGTLSFGAGANNSTLAGRVIFGATSGSTNPSVLDATNANLTVTGLTDQTFYNSAASTQANNIKIGVGKMLTVNGSTALGVSNTATANTIFTSDVFSGGGNFVANATGTTAFVVAPNNTQANFGNNVTVDMSGLNSATINIDSAGEFRLAGGVGNNTGNRSVAAMTLATTVANAVAPRSAITAGTVTIGGGSNSNGGTGNLLHLGTTNDAAHAAVNIINANSIRIGLDKASTTVDFLSTGSFGILKIRGFGGTDADRANITIGSRGQSGTANPASIVNLTGSGRSVDILAGTITIGESTNSSTGSGSFAFETGIVDANAITLAHRTNGTAIGTFTLGTSSSSTAVLNVNGAFLLANASPAAATATGTFNINGGTANLFGGISQTGANTANAVLNLNGGTLDMHGTSIGASGAAVTFNAAGGTLQNVSEINGGTSGLTKGGTGTLTLAGTNTYTGSTTINGGAVQLAGASAAQNSTLVINTNNGLTFAPLVGTFSIGSLSGSSNFALTDSGAQPVTLSVGGNSSSQTYSGAISGPGGALTLTAGTLTLAGNSTYTGNTTINGGSLVMASTGSLTSAVKVNSNGKLAGNMGAGKTVGPVTLSTGGTIVAGTSNGAAGVLNMNGLVVNGGTLQFNLGATPTSSLLNVLTGGTVFADPNQSGNSVPIISIPTSASAIGTYTLLQSNSAIGYPGGVPNFTTQFPTDNFTYHLNFSNPSAILLDVTGQISHLLWTGGSGAGDQITWDNTTNASSQNWKNTDTNVNGVNYADPAIVTFGDLASSTSVSISLNSNVLPSSITVGGASTSYSISGSGSIGGLATAVTKNGSTTLALLTANTYGGGTTINGGTVQINSAASLGVSTGAATIGAATLEVTSGSSILNSTRNFFVGSPTSTIQVDSSATYTISGAIADVSAGSPGTLNATGGGTLGLLGTNSYSGGTNISGGTIVQINSDSSLGAAASAIKINAGTLEALNSLASARNVQLGDATSTIQVDGAANTFMLSGTVSNGAATGTLNKTGAGILALSGNNTYSGGNVIGVIGNTSVAAGTLSISSDAPGALNLGPVSAVVAGSQFSNNVVLTNSGTLATTATMTLSSGRSIGLAGNGTINVAPGTILTYGGVITDDNAIGNLTVASSGAGGTLYLTGVSTYTGNTTISNPARVQLAAGTDRLPTSTVLNTATSGVLILGDANGPANQTIGSLQSGGASATPSILGGSAAVSTLTINYNGASTNYSRGIGGPGTNENNIALVFNGSGTLRLNAAGGANADNTYAGGTTINSGLLTAAQSHGYGALTGLVTLNGGTMGIEAGTTAATGISPYNVAIPNGANVNINSGRNANGAGFAQTLGSLNIGGATLNVNQGNFVTSGVASLVFSGPTTLTSAASATTVLNPTTANLNLAAITGSATSGNTATLQLDGNSAGNTISGAISNGAGGGNLTLLKSNTSTWTLAGNSTYTGTTTITGGTLKLGASDRIPDASNLVLQAGTFALAGFNETLGQIALAGSGTIDLGIGTNSLHAADSHTQTWSGTLGIADWTTKQHVFVGSTAGGLVSSQLSLITFSGFGPGASISSTGELTPAAAAITTLGDFNRDGVITTADLPTMLQALTDLNVYQSTYFLTSADVKAIGDLDSDGAVTNRDIQPLLNLIVANGGGSIAAVPEPASIALLASGLMMIGLIRRRHARIA